MGGMTNEKSSGIGDCDRAIAGRYRKSWSSRSHNRSSIYSMGFVAEQFFPGENEYKDNYWVQISRFNVQANANENIKAVTRFDIAQGWWGVDNEERTMHGASGLFDNKDTNFLMHVDQA